MQYTIVAINYFTIEPEALASLTPAKIKDFVYKNIIYWYESPTTSYLTMEHNSTVTN